MGILDYDVEIRKIICSTNAIVTWSRSQGVLDVVDQTGGPGFCLVNVVICRGPAHGSPGDPMFVQQVVVPASRRRSCTVLGGDGVPVEPVERYLAFLTDVNGPSIGLLPQQTSPTSSSAVEPR